MTAGLTKQESQALTSQEAWLVASCAALIAAVVYAVTASTAPGFHDSAELALRAGQLGATHAPGAPLHTLLGHILTRIIGNPAVATVWLSVLSGALGVLLATRIITVWSTDIWLPVAGGLAFAFVYPVWGNAVITELYALSVVCVATSIWLALRWARAGYSGFPVAMTLVFAFSLAAHVANILLLPAFVWLFLARDGWRARGLYLFLLASVVAVALIALANVLLAARVLPFGQHAPASLDTLLLYMSGAEHDPLADKDLAGYLARIGEHAVIFSRHYLYIGLPLAAIGLYQLCRIGPVFAGFLGLIFASYIGYFTLFGSGDYFVMVGPAYLICSIWLALGAATFTARLPIAQLTGVSAVLPGLFAAAALASQIPARYAATFSTTVIDYVEESFATLPDNAVAVARWNEFTALRYEQYVFGKRLDVDFLVPAESERHYSHGTVSSYLDFIDVSICKRPVLTNKLTSAIEARYRVAEFPFSNNWKQLYPADDSNCD